MFSLYIMSCVSCRRKRPSNIILPVEPFRGDYYGGYRGYRGYRGGYGPYYDPVVVQQPPVIIQTPTPTQPAPAQVPVPSSQDINIERAIREPVFISGYCFCMLIVMILAYLAYNKK